MPKEYKNKVLKRCPKCHNATKFQGPFPVGSFVDGKWVPERDLFQCLGCNAVSEAKDLEDFAIDLPE